jgi:hypothetical protein
MMTYKLKSPFKRVYFLSIILSIRYSEKDKPEIFMREGSRIYSLNEEKQIKTIN